MVYGQIISKPEKMEVSKEIAERIAKDPTYANLIATLQTTTCNPVHESDSKKYSEPTTPNSEIPDYLRGGVVYLVIDEQDDKKDYKKPRTVKMPIESLPELDTYLIQSGLID